MKNVFVVSWVKSENYGTCLQAYATNYILKKYANVRFVGQRRFYSIREYEYIIKRVIGIIKTKFVRTNNFDYGNYQIQHSRKVNKIEKLVSDTYEIYSLRTKQDIQSLDQWVDTYIVGSDQMWNPWMLSPTYLLDFVSKHSVNKKTSFAASFGVDNIPAKSKGIYRRLLKRFDYITVREPRAAELVNELVNKEAVVISDPTLLLTPNEWRAFAVQSTSCSDYDLNNDYILCYFIGAPEFNHLSTVKKLAKKLGKKIVLLPTKQEDYLINDKKIIVVADACPYDFIDLIDKAFLVCTDSFHAVVFSFLMSTPFYDFPRFKKGDKYSQDARLKNIIDRFKLTDSYWDEFADFDQIQQHLSCKYDEGYSVLEIERSRCLKIVEEKLI